MVLFGLQEKRETNVGIDLGADALHIVEIDVATTPYTVVTCLSLAWPEGDQIVPGVTDAGTIGSLVSRMLDERGIRLSKVSCALQSPSVFTKRIKTPELEWRDLKAHVELEAQTVIPPSAGGVQVDFHILRRLPRGELEVLVVAAKQEAISAMIEIIEAAELEIAVLDADMLATQNAVERALPDKIRQTVAIVNIGERFSTVSVRTKGIFAYSANIPLGISGTIDHIVEVAGAGLPDAYRLLFNSSEGERMVPEAVQSAVNRTGAEIARRLSLFWTVAEVDDPFDLIVLCGDGATMVGLRDIVQEKTGVPVIIIDPFEGFSLDNNLIVDRHPSHYTVAVGLALRTANDRITEPPEGV